MYTGNMKLISWLPKVSYFLLFLSLLATGIWNYYPVSASPAVARHAGNKSLITSSPNIPYFYNFTAIEAGYYFTCALTSGGGVKCWGYNYGSIPANVAGLSSGVIQIAAGGGHICVLLSTGGVKCWGSNRKGQLGDGTFIDRSEPVDVWGLTSGVKAIAAGGSHTCAILSSGGMKCWGINNHGQLGNDPIWPYSSTPVDVTGMSSGVVAITAGNKYYYNPKYSTEYGHTCALLADGKVKCWGYNVDGQVGNSACYDCRTPVDVLGLSGEVTALSAGSESTCALLEGGFVECWGNRKASPFSIDGLGGGVMTIDVGSGHTCAILTGGHAKCWGWNYSGQLGDGTTTSSSTPVDVVGMANGVSDITTGGSPVFTYDFTCALQYGGAKCWGNNVYGELGDGTWQNRITPVDVTGPSLAINYPDGRPGSFFKITGVNFSRNTPISIYINHQLIKSDLSVSDTGDFTFSLDTTGAVPGDYMVVVYANMGLSTRFTLLTDAPLRTTDGTEPVYTVPDVMRYIRNIYLPLIR